MELPTSFLARLGQRLAEILPIYVVQVDFLPPVVPTAHHVVHGPTVTGVMADGRGGEESAKQAEAALRTIGSNALPVLLLMAKAHDSTFKREWIRYSFRQSWIPYHPRSDFVYRGMAALGFFMLGSDAKPAVPVLTRLLSEHCADVRASTARTLSFMGDAALAACPALVKSLRDKDAETRLASAEALKKIDPEAAARAGVK